MNVFAALKKQFMAYEREERKKIAGGCNKLAFTAEGFMAVVQFLQSVADNNAIILPGRAQGFKNWNINSNKIAFQ